MKWKFLAATVAAFCLFVVAGCASRGMVSLWYDPDRWATACPAEVSVVPLADARGQSWLVMRDGVEQSTDRQVSEWMTDALRAELAARGMTVTNGGADSPFAADTVLSGEILRASMAVNRMEHKLDFEVRIVLRRGEGTVLDKTYTGSFEATQLPTGEKASAMLESGLSDLYANVMRDVCARLQ
ncbi:hypothetical protein GGQ74_002455 [Desulfobaculum xiamenense]|uniref:Lipoprotein n=1 Tax=Desulfobaculum xiamenense TaxID=995050 RepID=A0A846QQK5_9BACT|nr:LPS assembly lipoprotein LptE [Desulfobaculum xiamenense]NJB68782.1 hypothetical protein [Desulfobaculum xiamenense]